MFIKLMDILGKLLILTTLINVNNILCQKLNPDEKAPNFTLPALKGPLVYKGISHPDTNIHPPIIFHEFTNHSGFLECLWTKESSLLELIDNSPENTNYVFLTSANDAITSAEWMKSKFEDVLEKYFTLAKNLSTSSGRSAIFGSNNNEEQAQRRSSFENIIQHKVLQHNVFPLPRRRIDRRSLNYTYLSDLPKIRKPRLLKRSKLKATTSSWSWEKYNKKHFMLKETLKHKIPDPHLEPFHENFKYDKKSTKKRSLIYHMRSEIAEEESADDMDTSALQERVQSIIKKGKYKFIAEWLDRLHFVTIPLYEVGNWLPLIMSRWYCSGHGCGLDQVAVESNTDGDVKFVSKRLDGRYDWLPSPYVLKATHPRTKVVDYGNGCEENMSGNFTNELVLISRDGNCSFYTKIKHAQKSNVLGALIYTTTDEPLVDMTCDGSECEEEMKTPASMIPYESGKRILSELSVSDEVYIKFQHTPSRNFFVAIDEQGKLQEVGWLLYPSMIFLSYQAKWLNYKTNLLNNITNMNADVVNIFNETVMHGEKGVVKTIKMPKMEELQRYKHVYLDMALGCPGTSDYTCPHWDHTVQLYVCCNKTSSLCGKEIGRWITPFRRRIGRWLTNIRPLVPMLESSDHCTFTMKTVPWAMAWKPSLKLRLADPEKGSAVVPVKVIALFRGGKFDQTYNTKCTRDLNVTIPMSTVQVKFFATITGHGSDNNNCAEFCVTSHHFIINEKHKNTRIFDTAGTATGCADKVSEGSEPNEHGTWLYGRDGWCDGQNVSPWVEDITAQVNMGEENRIRYFGYFNGSDPNPSPVTNAGNIIMYSYLVLYEKKQENF